jgi:hypothetical protein
MQISEETKDKHKKNAITNIDIAMQYCIGNSINCFKHLTTHCKKAFYIAKILKPPSTTATVPVTKAAASLIR